MQLDPDVFNAVFPIVSMVVYPNGNVEIIRESKIQSDIERGTRDKVKVFSAASRNRLALVAKETPVKFETMITLTYGVQFPHSGLQVKNHLYEWIAIMRSHFGKFDYLWFFEFQARGAPHLHICTTLRPPTMEDRRVMSTIWVDFVQDLTDIPYYSLAKGKILYLREASFNFHLRKRQWEAVRKKDGIARYATKYALKMYQKTPPTWFGDVGRFWGHSKPVGEFEGKEYRLTEDTLRKVLDQHCKRMADLDILPRLIFDCFPDKSLTK